MKLKDVVDLQEGDLIEFVDGRGRTIIRSVVSVNITVKAHSEDRNYLYHVISPRKIIKKIAEPC